MQGAKKTFWKVKWHSLLHFPWLIRSITCSLSSINIGWPWKVLHVFVKEWKFISGKIILVSEMHNEDNSISLFWYSLLLIISQYSSVHLAMFPTCCGNLKQEKINFEEISHNKLMFHIVKELWIRHKNKPTRCPLFHFMFCKSIIPKIQITHLVRIPYWKIAQQCWCQLFCINFTILWINTSYMTILGITNYIDDFFFFIKQARWNISGVTGTLL